MVPSLWTRKKGEKSWDISVAAESIAERERDSQREDWFMNKAKCRFGQIEVIGQGGRSSF